MRNILTVNNISKIYNIHHENAEYKSLRDDVVNFAKHPLSAFFKNTEKFYALKNISFSLKQGETLGIIGSNGAGKSTLLKILSRITPPTKGEIRLRGRVSSLLEVGTGFHPELTGRENVFLSGAVLGMRQHEIKRKFDEIIDFSGVENFLDTPVKHFSSGMYTRLAFAVAAHLEPEILIVDEVLAVGDTAFQKKCLAKMNEAGNEGRTIIFVSHNMGAISELCKKCIFIKNGQIEELGSTAKIVSSYLSESSKGIMPQVEIPSKKSYFPVTFKQILLVNKKGESTSSFDSLEPFDIKIFAKVTKSDSNFIINVTIKGAAGNPLYNSQIARDELKLESYVGNIELILSINPNIFGTGTFSVTLTCDYQGNGFGFHDLISFTISNKSIFDSPKYIMYDSYVVYPRIWKVKKIKN